METKITLTPACPVCLKNYDCNVIPQILYPCGHGICMGCLKEYRSHAAEDDNDHVTCPLCRATIENEFHNYDLQHITNEVNMSLLPFWGQRFIESLDNTGNEVTMNKDILPFAHVLFVCHVYRHDFSIMGGKETWSEDERRKVHRFAKCFVQTLKRDDISVQLALKWLAVVNVPQAIENVVIQRVNKFYHVKQFLQSVEGVWLMDVFF